MKKISDYTIHCTEEQTKKSFELGAPLFLLDKMQTECFDENPFKDEYKDRTKLNIGLYAFCPTAEEMIGWLESNSVISEIRIEQNVSKKWFYTIYDELNYLPIGVKYSSSRKEATLAAIDAVLEYLSKNKK